MDIINVNDIGVRSVVLELRRKGTPCRFTIYPMIHLGEASFYREVSSRLARHDLIVAEGIIGPSPTTTFMTQVYTSRKLRSRLGLQLQPQDLYDVGIPVVTPDMTGPELERRWRAIGLPERAMWYTMTPAFRLYLDVFASREMVASHLQLDSDTLAIEEPSGLELVEIITDQRDVLLCDAVTRIHTERCEEDINVAVVYGAAHVAPLVKHLGVRHGYVPRSGEWLQVFSL
ncbi:hypothetical protein K1T35_13390 [Pseudonocardia sp. DSM 110487]|uniref:hypothetical protein n=1 Tax=Pseudonocardia sp. DSM 110487 TaxID=2865833 RepID=UPI001C6951E0|nr:hypothetical protein [Pseudonocardia sp. DSM 110487]QYN38135.1 hypothetical protein K1T35_13390 [Pseudonocardia sp. DSM 110487]